MDYTLYNHINEVYGNMHLERAKQEIHELWQLCFGDSDRYTDFYIKWKVKDNQVLTAYKDIRLSAMLHLNPYTLQVSGKSLVSNYIVGVATRKEDRRQGLMRRLIERSILQMYDEHMPFTYLMPASESIYLPFDFKVVYEQEQWNQNIKKYQNQNIEDLKVDVVTLNETDEEVLKDVALFSNDVLSKTYDIYVERSPYYYARLINEMQSCDGAVLAFYSQRKLVGSLSYMAEDNVYITEMITVPEQKDNIYAAAFEYFRRNVSKELYQREQGSQPPVIMTRIVHWNSFIETITSIDDVELNIKVTDPIIEANNKVFSSRFTRSGSTSMITMNNPDISASISKLTRFFFGRMNRSEMKEMIIGIDKENIINKMEKINTWNKVFINDVV